MENKSRFDQVKEFLEGDMVEFLYRVEDLRAFVSLVYSAIHRPKETDSDLDKLNKELYPERVLGDASDLWKNQTRRGFYETIEKIVEKEKIPIEKFMELMEESHKLGRYLFEKYGIKAFKKSRLKIMQTDFNAFTLDIESMQAQMEVTSLVEPAYVRLRKEGYKHYPDLFLLYYPNLKRKSIKEILKAKFYS